MAVQETQSQLMMPETAVLEQKKDSLMEWSLVTVRLNSALVSLSYGYRAIFYNVMTVVHGFVNVNYDVVEDERLDTTFRLNVKGMTLFSYHYQWDVNSLTIEGTITAMAGLTTSKWVLIIAH